MTIRDNSRSFQVVQFIELPFEGIDDYVCVPYSWLKSQKSSDGKVFVTYPNNEDPFDTRDRVKRKEEPNDEWKFYFAVIKYESEDYNDADFWIATRNDYYPDNQPELVLNRKLRSASQPSWSDPNSENPQLTVKSCENPRKQLPKYSIRRSVFQGLYVYLNKKPLKMYANAKPGIDTDHAIIAAGLSKRERSIIITDNQFIQNDQTKTNFASNGKMNTKQSTQPGVIENNQAVDMSVQSSSKKLLAEQQPSTFPSISCQNIPPEPVAEERLPTKTPLNTLEQTSQAEPIKERSTVLHRHTHSLSELHPRDVSARQSKEPNDSQKAYLNQNLTTSKIVPRPPSTANQPMSITNYASQ